MRFMNLVVALFLFSQILLAGTEAKGGHGMVVFGTNKIYISHLPMFMAQHRYQYIFEATIKKDGKDISLPAVDRFYTIEPKELFVLPQKLNALEPFSADLFDGHFEKPDGKFARKEVATGVTIQPVRLILAKQLRKTDKPVRELEEYFLFGNEKEQFVAHLIHGKPSFDEILQVKSISVPFKNATLAGTVVSVPARLEPNTKVDATLDDENPQKIKLEVGRIHYPDFEELK